jgi:hypothetical protein
MTEILPVLKYMYVSNLIFYGLGIVAGGLFGWLGYDLFKRGLFGKGTEAGGLEAMWKEWKVVVRKAAPGTFFALFGAAITVIALFKPASGFMASDGGLPYAAQFGDLPLFLSEDDAAILAAVVKRVATDDLEQQEKNFVADLLSVIENPNAWKSSDEQHAELNDAEI